MPGPSAAVADAAITAVEEAEDTDEDESLTEETGLFAGGR